MAVHVAEELTGPVAYEVTARVGIAAEPASVWRSLIEDVGAWWPHSFGDEPKIALEPWIGGRFYEEFGQGGGALYALVTYLEPGKVLRVNGAMGMPGARQYVKTYTLDPTPDGTQVTTVASMLGDIDDERRASYREGGLGVLESLKRFVETHGGAR